MAEPAGTSPVGISWISQVDYLCSSITPWTLFHVHLELKFKIMPLHCQEQKKAGASLISDFYLFTTDEEETTDNVYINGFLLISLK